MAAPGPGKTLCGAQLPNQSKGRTCRRVAGHGTDHKGIGRCCKHGGSTSAHRRAAEIEKAKAACSSLGLSTLDAPGPAEALLDELRRTYNNLHFYEQLVAQLPAHPGEDVDRALYGPLPSGEARPHVLVGLYNAERAHYAKVSEAALRAGVAARLVEIAGEQARQLAAVLVEFARALGHDPTTAPVREAGRKALALVSGGQ